MIPFRSPGGLMTAEMSHEEQFPYGLTDSPHFFSALNIRPVEYLPDFTVFIISIMTNLYSIL